ncbi:MAG TPA: hypothetical protein ENF32_03250 [Thermosulfidibacter takaii]|uniref:HEPN domain-containing protein n=1 Tax=Thermosulfidibacter takaii TaxID=412593 RepID=A0A7C0U6N5_9BACT|nr:MAG: hypothetical protein DRQ24_10765 [Candidatus Latescibacterota bacterium]HDD53070.1 hypothetical protein [Thermosulfidibacter takaii]
MTLEQWMKNGWLSSHKTSPQEIGNLLAIVERDLADASEERISPDWQFGIAYNAALKLCTILLYASGYRATRVSHHYYTIKTLPLILGEAYKRDAEYLDVCRSKRNIAEYDYVGSVTEDDVQELLSFVKVLKKEVIQWLRRHHPELIEG